jgi:uncharacterized membrane protein
MNIRSTKEGADMILQTGPNAPAIAHLAADALLYAHITGGCIGLISGATALLARKGSRLHRLAGNVFFASMGVAAAIGLAVGPFLPRMDNVVAAALTLYLIATGWMTVKRNPSSFGAFEIIAPFMALAAAGGCIMLGVHAATFPDGKFQGESARGAYILAGVFTIIATLDFSVILRHGISGAHRIARHLWRFCVPLLLGAASLFLGQPQFFSKAVHESRVLLAPELAVVGAMLFWLVWVYASGRFKRQTAGVTPYGSSSTSQ